MHSTSFHTNKISLLDKLIALSTETNAKSIAEDNSDFFTANINFFTKSFLVLMCAYLESYIKEASFFYTQEINKSLEIQKIPGNLLKWSIQKSKFDHTKETDCLHLKISITKDDIDKNVSANPYTTQPFFIRLGIDLDKNIDFQNEKEVIETIVNKRNSIVHHNDEASDIGLNDIIEYAEKIKTYITILDSEITRTLLSLTTPN